MISLLKHYPLATQFIKRNIQQSHKGSLLGNFWMLLSPLIMFSIYAIVFGKIFNGRYNAIENETSADYALGIFLSLTIFRLIAEIITQSPVLIVNQPNFVKKVVFPLEILSISLIGASIYNFLITMMLVFVGIIFWGNGLHVTAFWLPVLLLPMFLFLLGTSWLLSALGVFLRDIAKLMDNFSIVLMYSSAVFFSTAMIKDYSILVWNIIKWNPIIHFIDVARNIMLWNRSPTTHQLIYMYVSSFLIFIVGYWVFVKLKPNFADVL
jgi:lipopolysaccharide transport system permease protein